MISITSFLIVMTCLNEKTAQHLKLRGRCIRHIAVSYTHLYGSGKHNIQPEVETVNVSDYDLALAYAQNQYWWSDDYAIAITESNDDKFISYEALDSNSKGVRLCNVDREYAKQYYDSMQSEN